MRKIKLLLIFVMLLVLSGNVYFVTLTKQFWVDNYYLDIRNLDQSEDSEKIAQELLEYLAKEQINVYTSGGGYQEEKYLDYYYSNFENETENQQVMSIKSDNYPTGDNYIDNQNGPNSVPIFTGRNNEIRFYNIEQLAHQSLNRHYVFVDISVEEQSQLCQILNDYKIDYTFDQSDTWESNYQLIWQIIKYLLFILLLVFIINWINESKKFSIKALNGYNYWQIIGDEIIQHQFILKYLLVISGTLISIVLVYSHSIDFTVMFIGNYLPILLFMGVMIFVILVLSLLLSYLWIDLSSISNNIDLQFLFSLIQITKILILLFILVLIGQCIEEHQNILTTREEMSDWEKLENYYTSGYYNPTINFDDHIDFETMELDEMGEQSKEFIDKTEDELTGVIIDSINQMSETNECTRQYNYVCNSIFVNQNYLDLEGIKDNEQQSINMYNDKIDILIPSNLQSRSEAIVDDIKLSINNISPKFNYKQNDFLVHFVDEDTCFNLYNPQIEQSCLKGIAIEYGEYEYNYDLLISSGNYMVQIEQDNPYDILSAIIADPAAMYHFKLITTKSESIKTKYHELQQKQLINTLKISITIIVFIFMSYSAIAIFVSNHIQQYAIKILHGYSLVSMYKVYMSLNMICIVIGYITIAREVPWTVVVAIILMDNIMIGLFFERLSHQKLNEYIKGKYD